MGYNLTKRISVLKKQADEERIGHWSFFRTFLLAFIFLFVVKQVLPKGDYDSSVETSDGTRTDTWQVDLERQYVERLDWLERSPLVLFPGAPTVYDSFGQNVVGAFHTAAPKQIDEGEVIDFSAISLWLGRAFASALLRLGFVVIAFWPLWVLAALVGYFALRSKYFNRKSVSILGVCDRGNGPFYSGIYGPLRPNNSFSGTDLSCPNLACPAMVKPNQALTHQLVQLLKQHKALNDTNLQLVRVILAHADFPARVGEENSEEEDVGEDTDPTERASATGMVAPGGVLLEAHALEGLQAVLETQHKIAHYVDSLEKKGIKSSALNKNYPRHISNIERLAETLTPLGKQLLTALTPNRLWAIAHVPPPVVATAYLAIEAGKCLVFKRHGEAFVRISLYPHLQARAVVQSLVEYHQNYNGDTRLIIRQAIICSRRHGDFGRAFLPNRMPLESRAIRDWLEILYADAERREEAAHLVELDGHIEEVSVNWRLGFAGRLRKAKRPANPAAHDALPWHLWQGIAFKSVVLMPMTDLIEMALKGVHEQRRRRISELLALTRRYQTRISTSARLPGFRRQAMEADKSGEDSDSVVQALLSEPGGAQLVDRWRIVRRMLTRYNWLSTRIGDDAVPLAGLVEVVLRSAPDDPAGQSQGITAVVPLRQRRFVELLGKQWEKLYYLGSPQQEEVEIYVDNEKFKQRVAELKGSVQQNALSVEDHSAEDSAPEPALTSEQVAGSSKQVAGPSKQVAGPSKQVAGPSKQVAGG
ncbi:MAG: hypothetical protein KDD69_00840 [Bdellovibrionales bacterium]|nr:hypothetical protein [Bdellovibrionales bacterium]